MGKRREQESAQYDASQTWRVVDDLSCAQRINPAELDALEAFLMPLLNAILSGEKKVVDRTPAAPRPDSQAP
jgi:hypothetical protein